MNRLRTCIACVLMLFAFDANAHISSNGFLTLQVEGSRVRGSIEVAVRDTELAIGLDSNNDGKITWGEVRSHQRELSQYLQSHLHFLSGQAGAHAGSPAITGTVGGTGTGTGTGRGTGMGTGTGTGIGACTLEVGAVQINERVDGNYVWIPIDSLCADPLRELRIDYRLLQDVDPSHRGLIAITAWGETQTGVLTPGSGYQAFNLDHPSPLRAFAEYLKIGVWHIWSGIDHLLFLLSLLLPAVLRRRQGQWEAVPFARPAFFNILKVVTAFTLAHSITLSLAAFNVVHLPSRLTESVIAASIIVAALNNIFPRVTEGRWRIAFAFGLLHGFGFASVLSEMGLPSGARLVSLVAFNLGVEAGQLAVVLAIMPVAYFFRSTLFYRRTVMQWGSSAIATLALVWLVQRATG